MNRIALKRKRKEIDNQKKNFSTWFNLCKKYKADAVEKLSEVYEQTTSQKIEKSNELKCDLLGMHYDDGGILFDSKLSYIYYLNGLVYCGPSPTPSHYYPLNDKKLWPWTARISPLPDLYKNIFDLICKQLNVIDINNLRLTCKKWKDQIPPGQIWDHCAEFISQYIEEESLYYKVWEYYSNRDLAKWFKTLSFEHQKTVLLLNFSKLDCEKEVTALTFGTVKCNMPTEWHFRIRFKKGPLVSYCEIWQPKRTLQVHVNWDTWKYKRKLGATMEDLTKEYRKLAYLRKTTDFEYCNWECYTRLK